MEEEELSVAYIGTLARNILSDTNAASILGITSRGIFIKIGLHWVIFLSNESNRGPLTLNLNQAIITPFIDQTQPVDLRDGKIYFPKSHIVIKIVGAQEWVISPHPYPVLSPFERNQRILSIAKEVIARRGGTGLTPIFTDLLRSELPKRTNQRIYGDRIDIYRLQRILRSPNENQITAELQKLLGLGPGLTPSGDDFLIGFLLTYNRYPEVLNPPFDLSSINKAIVELAYQKTSLLSANLVECASLGQADEHLLLALDGILAGTTSQVSCLDHLLSWGHSSGCDAFLGMAFAAYLGPEIEAFHPE